VSATPREGIPHGFPLRLVEKVERRPDGTIVVALATADGFLAGVRPWPVTLVAEALAQAILLLNPRRDESALRLVGLDAVRLDRTVDAGDRLEIDVRELAAFGRLRRYSCRASSRGTLAAAAEITVAG